MFARYLAKPIPDDKPQQTDQEWAEVCYVPNWAGHSRKRADYRFLAIREPLRQQIRERATLSNDAPTPEVVAEMIEQASDRPAALLSAWNSGKIVHRQVAIRSFSQLFPAEQPLPPDFRGAIEVTATET